MQLSEIRTYVYNALDETSSTISQARVDAQIKTAFLWVVKAHDWPFFNITIENQSANDLVSNTFRRVIQLYDTETNTVIEPASTEKALNNYNQNQEGRPEVFTINQYGASNLAGVSLRLWPNVADTSEERFTVTGTLMPVEWPRVESISTDEPSLHTGSIRVAIPDELHFIVAQKATSLLAFQEQIRDIANFYREEAHSELMSSKQSLLPAVNTRLVIGSDAYFTRTSRPRGWR